MKNKQKLSPNYLDRKPKVRHSLVWSAADDGIVTLEIENKGVFNRVFQFLLKKPKVTYIHLDKMGSFVFPILDGQKTITDIGVLVKEHFGDDAEPLYERLVKYFQILESYGFIEFN